MKLQTLSVLYFYSVLFLTSCKDDDKITPTPTPAACILESESTNLPGNAASWTFEYDSDGKLRTINKFNSTGGPSRITDIGSSIIKDAAITGPAVPVNELEIKYEGDGILGKPTKAFLSVTTGAVTSVGFKTYFFFYDAKGRVNLVGEQTDFVIGDLEWDLHITYNDNDNVTSMYYEITTGPAGTGSKIVVDSFDDKPSPFTGIEGWKFMMHNFDWDNYDPEPIITALSKNNVTSFSLNKGMPGEYLVTASYEYNDKGFPTKRIRTNKNASGEATITQTFGYKCP